MPQRDVADDIYEWATMSGWDDFRPEDAEDLAKYLRVFFAITPREDSDDPA